MESRIEAHIRPKYIELLKMSTKDDLDEVARRFFARKEAQIRKSDPAYKVTHEEFWANFGIHIEDYMGHFAEIGGTPALRGASFPTDKVKPIFTIQMSRSGRSWKVITKSCPGFISNDLSRAWVEVDTYEQMLGDVFFEELQKKASKIEEHNRKQARREQKKGGKKVKVRNWVKS